MGTERVLLGKISSGVYGLKIAKEGVSVTAGTTPEDLLFDSTIQRVGVMYGGGFESSRNSTLSFNINSKPTLSYIPLVTYSESAFGEDEVTTDDTDSSGDGTETFTYSSRVDFHEFTATTITPSEMSGNYDETNSNTPGYASTIVSGRSTFPNCTALTYKVLRIPCAYGYMNNSSLWTGSGSTKRVLVGKNVNSNHGFSTSSPGFGVFVSRPGKDVTTCSADDLLMNTSNSNQTGSSFVSPGTFQALPVRTVAGVPRADFQATATSSGATQAITNVYSHLGTVGGVDLGQPSLPQTSVTSTGAQATFTSSTSTVFTAALMPTFSNLSAF